MFLRRSTFGKIKWRFNDGDRRKKRMSVKFYIVLFYKWLNAMNLRSMDVVKQQNLEQSRSRETTI